MSFSKKSESAEKFEKDSLSSVEKEVSFPINKAFQFLVDQHLVDIIQGRPEAFLNIGIFFGKLNLQD